MARIVVASNNPVKIEAVKRGFEQMFPGKKFEFETIAVSSGVGSQPKNNKETLAGAVNRAKNASRVVVEADFWVGIEGGVEKVGLEYEAFAWVVIKSNGGPTGRGKTGIFVLPKEISKLIEQGDELGTADDKVFKRHGTKRDNGAVGLLTGNVIDRTKYYTDAVVLALIPFKNPSLY